MHYNKSLLFHIMSIRYVYLMNHDKLILLFLKFLKFLLFLKFYCLLKLILLFYWFYQFPSIKINSGFKSNHKRAFWFLFTQPCLKITIEQSIWLNSCFLEDVVPLTSIFLWLKFMQCINDVVNEHPDLLAQGNCNRNKHFRIQVLNSDGK